MSQGGRLSSPNKPMESSCDSVLSTPASGITTASHGTLPASPNVALHSESTMKKSNSNNSSNISGTLGGNDSTIPPKNSQADPRQLLQKVLSPEFQEQKKLDEEGIDNNSAAPQAPPTFQSSSALDDYGSTSGGGTANASMTSSMHAFEAAEQLLFTGVSTPVRDWLLQHHLVQYAKGLSDEGFDDLEELKTLAMATKEDNPTFEALFRRLVPAAGHQAKIRRLLVAQFPSKSSGLPLATHSDPVPLVSSREAAGIDGQNIGEGSPSPVDPNVTAMTMVGNSVESSGREESSNAGGESETRGGGTKTPMIHSLSRQRAEASPTTGAENLSGTSSPTSGLQSPGNRSLTSRPAGKPPMTPGSSVARPLQTTAANRSNQSPPPSGAYGSRNNRRMSRSPSAPDVTRGDLSAVTPNDRTPTASMGAYSQTRTPTSSQQLFAPGRDASAQGGSTPRLVRRPSGINLGSEPITIKVIVVGAPCVGKTSFVRRLVNNEFVTKPTPTIGIDYFAKKFRVGENTLVTMQLWDVWGQDSFSHLSRSILVGAKGAFILYDCLDEHSLTVAAKWKREVDSKTGFSTPGGILPAVLVGNKADLGPAAPSASSSSSAASSSNGDSRVLNTKEKVLSWTNEHRFMDHQFVSAKTGMGVQEAAEFLLSAILKTDPSVAGHAMDKVTKAGTSDVFTLDESGRPQTIGGKGSKSKKSSSSTSSRNVSGGGKKQKVKGTGGICSML